MASVPFCLSPQNLDNRENLLDKLQMTVGHRIAPQSTPNIIAMLRHYRRASTTFDYRSTTPTVMASRIWTIYTTWLPIGLTSKQCQKLRRLMRQYNDGLEDVIVNLDKSFNFIVA
jgi:hypothetical protein